VIPRAEHRADGEPGPQAVNAPRNAESDRLRSERYIRLVAEHTSDVIIVTDVAGRLEWANKQFEWLTGYTVEETAGSKPGDVLQGPDTDPETVATVSRALKLRQPVAVEILNYARGGRAYWLDMRINPVFDADGRHTHFVAVERDVTERRQQQRELVATRASDAAAREERELLAETSEGLYAARSID